jgi:hypothetical protein
MKLTPGNKAFDKLGTSLNDNGLTAWAMKTGSILIQRGSVLLLASKQSKRCHGPNENEISYGHWDCGRSMVCRQ